MSGIDQVVAHVDENFDGSVERLFELLRIESISTDPAYAAACGKAADWLVGELNGLGFAADVRETIGHPMVVGHYTPPGGAEAAPHVLFYGHYDVQPVDPLDLWETPPFEPRRETVDGSERIVARGAADDKGQLMTFLEAARAWIGVAGALPLRGDGAVGGRRGIGLKEPGARSSSSMARSSRPIWRSSATPACGTRRRPRSPRACAACIWTR